MQRPKTDDLKIHLKHDKNDKPFWSFGEKNPETRTLSTCEWQLILEAMMMGHVKNLDRSTEGPLMFF
jgi:hypothetical protein